MRLKKVRPLNRQFFPTKNATCNHFYKLLPSKNLNSGKLKRLVQKQTQTLVPGTYKIVIADEQGRLPFDGNAKMKFYRESRGISFHRYTLTRSDKTNKNNNNLTHGASTQNGFGKVRYQKLL